MNLDQLFAKIARLSSTLSAGQIATLVAAFIAVIGVVGGSAYWVATPSYTLLYSDLDAESASAVVTRLKAANSPYLLDQGGRAVLVPATRVDELRLDLAAEGLPMSGRVGFEIFDRTSFGTTEFLEHVNYRRGLEGELARTIGSISEVASARVHIALAKESLFAATAEEAKASVVLKLRSNRPLAPSAIAGIAGLVAASVESLRPESVVIIDTFGRPLSKIGAQDEDAEPGRGIERQQRLERDLTMKVMSMLEPVVGVGHVRVNVSAPLDAGSEEQTEERFDPATSVVRSKTSSSDTTASNSARGVAGARGNAPPDLSTTTPPAPPPASVVSGGETGRTSETTNYEISRVTRHTIAPGGGIIRLSVAVIVDDARVPTEDGTGTSNQPRDPAEMERIKGLVSAAVGFDAERGDQITVENIAFEDTNEPVVSEPEGPWWKQIGPTVVTTLGVSIGDLLRWILISMLALVALLHVVRPVVRSVLAAVPAIAALPAPGTAMLGGSGKTVAQLQGEMAGGLEERPGLDGRVPVLTRSIAKKAEQKPEHVAELVRAMLAQEDK